MLFILTGIEFTIIKLIVNKYFKFSVLIFIMINIHITQIKKNSTGSIIMLKNGVYFLFKAI